MKQKHLFRLSVTFLLGFVGSHAAAHEFWISPVQSPEGPDAVVELHLQVGDAHNEKGEAFVRKPSHLKRFWIVTPDGSENDVQGVDGHAPAGLFRPNSQGTFVIAYESTPSFIQIEADKFNTYLEDEGLETILKLRSKRGEKGEPGREMYTRCAKSLVKRGDSSVSSIDKTVGLPLELVLLDNPSILNGSSLRAKLTFQNKPVANALVHAMHRNADGTPVSLNSSRTGEDGIVELKINSPGFWLISTVHMTDVDRNLRQSKELQADWHSFWASLTFEVP